MTLVLDKETYIYMQKSSVENYFHLYLNNRRIYYFTKNTKYVHIYLDKTLRTEWSGKVLPNLMAVNATKISNC